MTPLDGHHYRLQTKHLSAHTVHSSWPISCLLLFAKGFQIHADMHRWAATAEHPWGARQLPIALVFPRTVGKTWN